MTTTFTTTSGASFEAGDTLEITRARGPWWRRLWRWIRRGFRTERPEIWTVSSVESASTSLIVPNVEPTKADR